jgi:transglutaminase-like putative cysteine protease
VCAALRHSRAHRPLADVRNHLSTPRLLELLKSDVFAMHGYTELYLNGRWVKATPAFNQQLCELFNARRWNSTESTTVFSTRSTAMASG